MKKSSFFAVIAVSVSLLSFLSCTKSNKTIIRMQHIEEGVGSPTTIEEYKDAISKYEERVADIQIAQGQIGIWHKIVGTKYLDKKMYGEALKSFQTALEYYPDNQNLYYYVGLCSSYIANTSFPIPGACEGCGKDLDEPCSEACRAKVNDKPRDMIPGYCPGCGRSLGKLCKDCLTKGYTSSEEAKKSRLAYLKVAEDAYSHAIKIEPKFARALYALAVLYDFELKQPEKAVPHLETLLSVEKNHLDGMILLGRCYYETYEFDKAIEIYDRFIASTKSADKKKMAEDLKQQVIAVKTEFGE